MTPSAGPSEPQQGDLPEVRPYGVPGLLVHGDLQQEKLDYDFYLDAAYEYEAEVIDKGIREQAERRARLYLSENGDAVWARVERGLADAAGLLPAHPGASLVLCMSAAELTVRFLLLRPLLAGLIFDDVLAERLSAEASTGPAGRDRQTLPHVCRAWEIEISGLAVSGAGELWPTYGRLWAARDNFVHRGSAVSAGDASVAIACARTLIDKVLVPVARRLAMRWPDGAWLAPTDQPKDPFASR